LKIVTVNPVIFYHVPPDCQWFFLKMIRATSTLTTLVLKINRISSSVMK